MSGTAPYRVTFHDGQVQLIEIWRENQRMTFGRPQYAGRCARCGVAMPVFTPDNDTMEVCDRCDAVLRARGVA